MYGSIHFMMIENFVFIPYFKTKLSMRKSLLLSFIFFNVIIAMSQNKPDKRFAGIDTTIERFLKEWHASGCAVAVVHKDKVIYSRGFGYKDYNKRLPVTENTVFAIGSCSKAFTSSLLGMLVQEGKLDLDRPVNQYLPDMQFYNDYLTNHLTARDMMSHRTGLPRHDYSWYGSSVSRDSLVKRLRYLEPSAELRQKWQYNNMMFLAQGVIAEKLYNSKWETLVKTKIFEPLGMNSSNFSVIDLQKGTDYTFGYREHKDSVIRMEYINIDPVGPAGSINSNVKDMAQWLITWIQGGKYKNKEVLPASYVAQATSSQMAIGGGIPSKENPDVQFSNYGFGWFLSSYRSHYMVQHGGNINGFSANTSFFPSDSIGIVVLVNQNGSPLPSLIRNTIADKILNLPYRNWNKMQREAVEKNKAAAKLKGNADSANKKPNTRPSHNLSDYAGIYHHPGYGAIKIVVQKDTLRIDESFSAGKLYLTQYHYDVFNLRSTDDDDDGTETTKINFLTGNKGDIDGFRIRLEPTIRDIEFQRLPPVIKMTKNELQQYTGEYDLNGMPVKIYLRGDSTLMALVQGQPDYELIATKKDEFNIKVLQGYTIKFDYAEGIITGLSFLQPNGIFKAKKKK